MNSFCIQLTNVIKFINHYADHNNHNHDDFTYRPRHHRYYHQCHI